MGAGGQAGGQRRGAGLGVEAGAGCWVPASRAGFACVRRRPQTSCSFLLRCRYALAGLEGRAGGRAGGHAETRAPPSPDASSTGSRAVPPSSWGSRRAASPPRSPPGTPYPVPGAQPGRAPLCALAARDPGGPQP